jgi:hypothetical protein
MEVRDLAIFITKARPVEQEVLCASGAREYILILVYAELADLAILIYSFVTQPCDLSV